jgi:hypothetical protein
MKCLPLDYLDSSFRCLDIYSFPAGPLSLPLDLLRLLFSRAFMDTCSLTLCRSTCKLLARLIPL